MCGPTYRNATVRVLTVLQQSQAAAVRREGYDQQGAPTDQWVGPSGWGLDWDRASDWHADCCLEGRQRRANGQVLQA